MTTVRRRLAGAGIGDSIGAGADTGAGTDADDGGNPGHNS